MAGLVFRDPNTNKVVASNKALRIKEQVNMLGQSLELAKNLQKEAIKGIDQNNGYSEESQMAILELFEGRESDKLELEEARAQLKELEGVSETLDATQKELLETKKDLNEAQGELGQLRMGQEELMQAILEIYETGAVEGE